jgi:hypothetical protein
MKVRGIRNLREVVVHVTEKIEAHCITILINFQK